MHIKMDLLAKALRAHVAREGAFLAVDQFHVFVQHGLVGARVTAGVAAKRLLVGVHGLYMGFQVHFLPKRSTASAAVVMFGFTGRPATSVTLATVAGVRH